ncbi:MAG TPA: class I SAM-dependent methyltransferase [Burkholderiales bacterium]
MLDASAAPDSRIFVPESRIGFWFLGTETWATRVIRVALRDLDRLIPEGHRPRRPLVLDVGCGQGKSFLPLFEQFSPSRIIGIDFDEHCVAAARAAAGALPVDVRRGELSRLDLADRSVDLVFCHQTFHHLTRQQLALGEFYRVLKPGGLLLFAESTRAYIHSWIIRLLFRHPMEVQRSAGEYQQMIRACGFEFGAANVSYPYLWWSRPDLGSFEFWGLPAGTPGEREETLINLVAVRPG